VRRIEALTGEAARRHLDEQDRTRQALARCRGAEGRAGELLARVEAPWSTNAASWSAS
jgi:alanyl-tRNA synthetase